MGSSPSRATPTRRDPDPDATPTRTRPRLGETMASGIVKGSALKLAGRVPGVRRIPVVALLSAAEVAILAKEHYQRLTPEERRRLVALVRRGRGRTGRLNGRERDELEELIAKLEPRRLLGDAAGKLSPVPLPDRLKYGKRP